MWYNGSMKTNISLVTLELLGKETPHEGEYYLHNEDYEGGPILSLEDLYELYPKDYHRATKFVKNSLPPKLYFCATKRFR